MFAPSPKIITLFLTFFLILGESAIWVASKYDGASYKPLWYIVPAIAVGFVIFYIWLARFQYMYPYRNLRYKHRKEAEEAGRYK